MGFVNTFFEAFVLCILLELNPAICEETEKKPYVKFGTGLLWYLPGGTPIDLTARFCYFLPVNTAMIFLKKRISSSQKESLPVGAESSFTAPATVMTTSPSPAGMV